MKTLFITLSIFISTLAYSQSQKEINSVDSDQKIYANEWLLNECQSKEGLFDNSFDSDSVTDKKYSITENKNPNLTPKIKCPKKIHYKLASNLSLNGLNKLVLHIQ